MTPPPPADDGSGTADVPALAKRLVPRQTRRTRWILMVVALIVVGIAVGLIGAWHLAATAGWAAACLVYVVWIWLTAMRMGPGDTSHAAFAEEPKRAVSDVLLVAASIASLFSLIVVLGEAKSSEGAAKDLIAGLACVSVVLSWFLVHTLFTLRYAELYYSGERGGVDFNEERLPRYSDFAYLAFTIGMTFQVSDTDIKDGEIRATILRHMLLSYLFGSVIIASAVNFVVSIGS